MRLLGLVILSFIFTTSAAFAQVAKKNQIKMLKKHPNLTCGFFINGVFEKEFINAPHTTIPWTNLDDLPQLVDDNERSPMVVKTLGFPDGSKAKVTVPLEGVRQDAPPNEYHMSMEVTHKGITHVAAGSGTVYLRVIEEGKHEGLDGILIDARCKILY